MVRSFYTIAEVQGIKVNLHITFIALVALVALYGFVAKGPFYAASISLFIIVLFGTVFLHELSHAAVARHERVRVESVNLLPIGGVASIDTSTLTPSQEFKMALAGPLLNVLVCIVLIVFDAVGFLNVPTPPESFAFSDVFDLFQSYPLYSLFLVNFMLAAFNLLVPALPMDGGRVLRALLAMRFGFFKATLIASRISTFLAIPLFFLGIFTLSPFLPIIAYFVYTGAKQEAELAMIEHSLSGVKVSAAFRRNPRVLEHSAGFRDALNAFNRENATALLVDYNEHYRVVHVEDVVGALRNGKKAGLEKVAVRVPHVSPKDSCALAFKQLLSANSDVLPVVSSGKLLGVVYRHELEMLYRLKSAEKILKQ